MSESIPFLSKDVPIQDSSINEDVDEMYAHNETKLQDGLKPHGLTQYSKISDSRQDKINTESEMELDCWMMGELGSMNLLHESNYCIKEEEVSTAPIDRGWAWAAVAGCFGMHILAVGGIKSFGVLFVEFEHRFDTTSSALALVQAVSDTFMMGMCPISNALSVKFGCRRVVFVGGVLLGLGFVTSAFIPSFPWLYLTYGVIGGLGIGLSYAPSIVFVGHHFEKHRALANGLSLSGSGVGTIIFPAFIYFFNEWYGLPGALLLIGGIMLNVCACASLYRPISSYKNKLIKTKILLECHDEEHLIEDTGAAVRKKLETEKHLCADYKQQCQRATPSERALPLRGSTCDIMTASLQNLSHIESVSEDRKICRHTSKMSQFVDFSICSNSVFLVFLCSTTISTFAYPNIFLMIPSYGEELGMDQQSGALLLSVMGISDLVGRVFMGWFSDRKLLPRKYEFMGTMGISGLLTLVLPFVKSKDFLFAYCGLYGFFGGSYNCLIAVILVDTLGVEKLSVAFGFVGFGLTLGLLTGPPLIGAIRDASGSWDGAFIFVAIMALIGTSVILLEPLAQRRSKTQKDQETMPCTCCQ